MDNRQHTSTFSVFIYTVLCALLLIASSANAAAGSITLGNPKEGLSIASGESFAFTVTGDKQITNCSILLDNQSVKTTTYKDNLTNKNLALRVQADPGTYTWTAICEQIDGSILRAGTSRTVTIQEAANDVTITSSGLFRGSLIHSISVRSAAGQKPVTIPAINSGDFVGISLFVAPSNIKKELYLRERSSINDKQFIILEDQKEGIEHKIFLGDNETVNFGTSKVIINFKGVEASKTNLIVYPFISASGSTTETTTSEETNDDGTQSAPNGTTVANNSTEKENTTGAENEAQTPTQPTQNDSAPNAVNPNENTQSPPTQAGTNQTKTDDAQTPKPNAFERFISWLVGIFGS